MCFPLVAPTSRSPLPQLMASSGEKGWWLITMLHGWIQPQQVAGNPSTRDSEIHKFLFGGAWPFYSVMLQGIHFFVNALMYACLIATIQREGQRPTWVVRVSNNNLLRCSFSSWTSPSRSSCGQPSNKWNVSTDLFLLSTNALRSYCLCILIELPMHLVLMVVCMCGVGTFGPFHFMLKSPDTNDALW